MPAPGFGGKIVFTYYLIIDNMCRAVVDSAVVLLMTPLLGLMEQATLRPVLTRGLNGTFAAGGNIFMTGQGGIGVARSLTKNAPGMCDENEEALTISVNRAGVPDKAVIVCHCTRDGDAERDDDYQYAQGDLKFELHELI